MITQLTETTKQRIKKAINHIANDYLEEDSTSFCKEPFADFPPLVISRVNNLAVEKFCENFDKIEFGYDLLQDYYDKNGNVKNKKTLKKLSCQFAESLIN